MNTVSDSLFFVSCLISSVSVVCCVFQGALKNLSIAAQIGAAYGTAIVWGGQHADTWAEGKGEAGAQAGTHGASSLTPSRHCAMMHLCVGICLLCFLSFLIY
jgi:hypothetical protein